VTFCKRRVVVVRWRAQTVKAHLLSAIEPADQL